MDFSGIIDAARTALGNQFVTGGLVLGLVGTLIAAARSWPGRMWLWVRSKIVVGVYVHNDDEPFRWLATWLDQHPYTKRARTLTAMSEYNDEDEKQLIFTPAPGNHLLWVNRRPVWLYREREKADDKSAGFGARTKESFFIGVVARTQEPVRTLLEEAKKVYDARHAEATHIYVASYGHWAQVGRISRRTLESVILPDNAKELVVSDIQRFRDREEWYFQLGIPYHRGYLFHGTPGSGKTSLITALASHFNYNLYLINLGNKMLNDDSLAALINSMEPNSLLLFEDVDCAKATHERTDHGKRRKDQDSSPATGVSLSGLLNCLDGLLARDGTIVFMTTNHRDQLDPALVRAGRCDVHVEFTTATLSQACAMFERFFPEVGSALSVPFATAAVEAAVPMATLQEILSTHSENPEAAVAAARDLLKPKNTNGTNDGYHRPRKRRRQTQSNAAGAGELGGQDG